MIDIPEREQIPEMYLKDGLSIGQIAERVGLSIGAVHSILKVRGVQFRKSPEGKKLRYIRYKMERDAEKEKKSEEKRKINLARMELYQAEVEAKREAERLKKETIDRETVLRDYLERGGSKFANFSMMGRKQSDHQKQTVSEALKGNKHGVGHVVTPEHRAILAEARRGAPGTNTGRKFSAEHRRKLSEANKGQKRSEETKAKIAANRAKQVLPVEDTLPERLLQEELTKRGVAFQKHKPIPGLPDLFIEPNVCVFADGDYWHNIAEIAAADVKTNEVLRDKGYIVLRFWEKDIKASAAKCVDQIVEAM